ncbi:hypothetical protein CEK26_006479 [Fusarium fujikuroi]|uniref:Uncharacterized protein n=1 Tax=Fusarium fujikuroi TaxID=5127 RepID=A0A5Q3D721_FUSFU|nr:hypothetical protein CEK27_006487 [Fusarium fujikuroi]QGI79681.1 hypothetical protein CEK25_006410 [Fusarium fujikuroi]QGI93410.1 hypothetical protein CEK26_006479 [Fusarium fujikuroi]VTT63954.1 unnamed protein product [Fusarium fujikuroi]
MTTNMTTNNPDTLWVAHGSEELEEADEPPEITLKKQQFTANDFQRTTIRPPTEKSSLLTKAINGNSDDDLYTPQTISRPMANTQRRRSLVSNISLASTADLTSDTGFTSPSRPNTPSPPLPEMAMLRLHDGRAAEPTHVSLLGAAVRLQQGKTEEPRKRSIQFACVAKPVVQEQPPRSQPMAKAPSAQEAPRKSCIKFACPARPASTQNTPPRYTENCAKKDATPKAESPSTPKRMSALAFAAPRQVTPRRHSMSRPRFLRADSSDLVTDSSQFHEFASGITREDDWIRRDSNASDSSITTVDKERANRRSKRVRYAEEAPDLPDSTDFVCGTLDEDRPLEEAYLSCLAARRNEKLRVIPQDIDPSFPASEPEEENEGEIFNPVHHSSDEDDEFFQGKMEDLHQERDRPRRRRKSEHASPKRFRSPPPKRHHSPPPKVRGRSPKPLFDRQSPRKAKSPAPMRKPITTPLGSPRCGQVNFNLAGRPGLTHTKSLPRGGAMCHQRKQARHKVKYDNDTHIRGAIDIVKGLESKRQRRKEKFHQKYCNRARRGQIPERKPVPGRGTERMRELGLLMAGKKDQTNYVLSI